MVPSPKSDILIDRKQEGVICKAFFRSGQVLFQTMNLETNMATVTARNVGEESVFSGQLETLFLKKFSGGQEGNWGGGGKGKGRGEERGKGGREETGMGIFAEHF